MFKVSLQPSKKSLRLQAKRNTKFEACEMDLSNYDTKFLSKLLQLSHDFFHHSLVTPPIFQANSFTAKAWPFPAEKVNTETFKMNWVATSIYCTSSCDVHKNSCYDLKKFGLHDTLIVAHLPFCHTEIVSDLKRRVCSTRLSSMKRGCLMT